MEETKKIDRGGDEVRALLEKNLELNSEIYKMVKGIKRYVIFQQTMSVIKILVFAAMVVISLIYLPPLMGQAFGYYKELLGGLSGMGEASGQLQALDLNSIQGLIKK